jgi:signal recognition particle receptor subunit beta
MVSLNTETDRTLFFDLLPMDVGVIGGFRAKLQLYTVPGQVFYNSTRKLVLKGVDGIVFVADSQVPMLDANRESLHNLSENLKELGLNLRDIPMVFQWNKRDLKHIVPLEVLERELNPGLLGSFQAIARSGPGVFETLRGISRLALAQIKRLHLSDPAAAPPPLVLPVPPLSPPQLKVAQPGVPARGLMPAELPTPTSLPEALGFLDPSSAGGARMPEMMRPAARSGDSGVKVMAPLVVKLPQPQHGKPLAGTANGAPRLHLTPTARILPPGPSPAPAPTAQQPPPSPLLRLELPKAEGGALTLQVQILRDGQVVAEAAAPLPPAPGGGAEIVGIELRRS